MIKESAIERYLIKRCKELDIMIVKNTGMNGIPDRVIFKNGILIFLELKRPNEKPRELQKAVIKKIKRHGILVRCADTKQKIDKLLEIFDNPKKQRLFKRYIINKLSRGL